MAAVLALVDDLMFLSRIREAARGAGAEVRTVRDVAGLLAGVRSGARTVLLDLDSARLPWREALDALRAEPAAGGGGGVATIGFFSHVDTASGREAADRGCTQALPRGAFVQRLPSLLGAA